MSRHSFDPEIAKQVGLNAAVIYQNILWWAEKNAANGKHYHDGLWWTYNSVSAFAELFPYLTGKQIRTALDKLVQEGLLATGRFNKSAYDQTKWYAPTCLKDKADLPKQANETAQNGKPIPDIKPDHKPVGKRIYRHAWENGLPDWLPMDAWEGWIEMRNQRKKPLTGRAVTRALDRLREFREKGQNITEVLDRSTMNGWTDLYEIREQNNGKAIRGASPDRRSSLARAIDEGLDFLV